ncbi:FUSC family protein [Pedobacter sp. NJ-S-72]
MTPYILVLFDFLGMGSLSVARERIFDTLIGSAIALLGSYTLFPNWENKNLKEAMISTLKANMAYFDQVTLLYTTTEHNLTNYRLARKEIYVTSANLSSIFQKMFSEPKSKQRLMTEMHQFTALNHLLSSYTATLSLYFKEHSFSLSNPDELKPIVNNTLYLLNLSAEYLVKNDGELSNVPLIKSIQDDNKVINPDEMMIIEQYDMIQKVAYDIFKLSERIKI